MSNLKVYMGAGACSTGIVARPVEVEICLNYTLKEASWSGVLLDSMRLIYASSRAARGESTDGIRLLTYVPGLNIVLAPFYGLRLPGSVPRFLRASAPVPAYFVPKCFGD